MPARLQFEEFLTRPFDLLVSPVYYQYSCHSGSSIKLLTTLDPCIINFEIVWNPMKHSLCVKQYLYLCFESEMLIWEVIQRSPHSVAKATEMALKTKEQTSDWLIQCRPTLDWSEFQGIHWRKIKALGNSPDARMLSLLQELPQAVA